MVASPGHRMLPKLPLHIPYSLFRLHRTQCMHRIRSSSDVNNVIPRLKTVIPTVSSFSSFRIYERSELTLHDISRKKTGPLTGPSTGLSIGSRLARLELTANSTLDCSFVGDLKCLDLSLSTRPSLRFVRLRRTGSPACRQPGVSGSVSLAPIKAYVITPCHSLSQPVIQGCPRLARRALSGPSDS